MAAIKISLSQKIAWWLNLLLLIATGLPMAIVPIKPLLPEHWFGVLATAGPLITFVILTYQNYRKTHPYPTDDGQNEGA